MKQKTISIIGFGNIGRFICAQLLPYTNHALKINLIDNDEKVEGAILDFKHGLELFPHHEIQFNDAELFNDSDLIFHCAGASVPKGQDRYSVCDESVAITESVYKEYQAKASAFIIIVANPVEVIATVSQQLSGLPPNQIIGVGTYLDSVRMDFLIRSLDAKYLKSNSIVLGEHGSTSFLSTSLSSVNAKAINEVLKADQIETLEIKMKKAAEEIKASQSATIYGVGYCAMEIFYALMGEKTLKIAASATIPDFLKKELGDSSIYLSLYSKVDQKGISPIDHDYLQSEIQKLQSSRDLIISCIPRRYLDKK